MLNSSKISNIGLSISPQVIELAVFSPKSNSIVDAVGIQTPPGMLDTNGDRLLSPQLLRDALTILFKQVRGKVDAVNLTLPGSLFRMVDMPKMAPEQLYVSLSSEAERYRTFDNTEAVVDFTIVENNLPLPQGKMNVVFAALRQDSLEGYLSVFKALRIKVATISLEPIDVLRGMAGTGVLDSLVEQIGGDEFWGTIFVEPERVRISLWQGSTLFEFRETNINTSDFANASVDSMTVTDMVEEVRRTTKIAMPRIWLTQDMAPNMQHILTDLLAVPVRDCNLGSALALSNPNLRLPTIGAALQSVVPFPFPMNLAKGLSSVSKSASSSVAALPEAGSSEGVGPLITIGVGALVILLIAAGCLALGGAALQGQVAQLQTQFDTKQSSINALTAQKTDLEAKVSVYQKLKAALDEARIRNRVYVMLADDLQNKKPRSLWVQDIHVGGHDYDGKIAFEGKAHNHEDVLYYARRFDGVPYVKDFAIEQIKERRILGTSLFDYKIQGSLDLDQSLLPAPKPESSEVTTPPGTP